MSSKQIMHPGMSKKEEKALKQSTHSKGSSSESLMTNSQQHLRL